ncbi:MAG: substrate-binding domain-containing protein [Pirellulaceae bacterium]|nr:substrate-binding domain-containing protein [Pirellulaceae bacterium]
MLRIITLAGLLVLPLLLVGCGGDSKVTTDEVKTDGSAATAGSPKSTAGKKRLIFLTNGNSPFWDACRSGLVEGAKEFKLGDAGLTVAMEVNDGTAQGQIDKLRQYASQSDVAGVAVSVIQADNPAIVEEMKNLQAKGIKIITVDGDVNRDTFRNARPYYLGTDNIVGGRVLGTAAQAILKSRKVEKGGYVQFAGFTDNDNARNRMNGFKEAVGEAYEEKDRMPDGMDLAKARDNVRNAITNHKDLVALVGIWSYNAPAIAEVATERNVRDKISVVTFDAEAGAIEQMTGGTIDAMVVQNPFDMGYQTVKLLKAMFEKDDKTIKAMFPNEGQKDGDIYTTGLRVVVPEKDTPLTKEMFDAKSVEYMTLPQFKEWLTKYNLSSS